MIGTSASPASSRPKPSLSYGGQRLLDMGLALATRRACCCSTSRWPALRPPSASESAS